MIDEPRKPDHGDLSSPRPYPDLLWRTEPRRRTGKWAVLAVLILLGLGAVLVWG